MPYVAVKTGSPEGRLFPLLKKRTLLGRADECDIPIPDKNVSRHHAECLLLEDNLVTLVDLGSSNGTFVNEIPISRIFLMPGDEIRLGETVFVFHEGSVPESPEVSEPPLHFSHDKLLASSPSTLAPETYLMSAEQLTADALKETYLKLRTLYRLFQEIQTAKKLDDVFSITAESMLLSIPAERVVFFLYDSRREKLLPHSTHVAPDDNAPALRSYPIGEQALDDAKNRRTPLMFSPPDASADISDSYFALCVPLLRGNTLIGLVYVDRPLSKKPFTNDDLSFVALIADQVASVITRLEDFRRLEQKSAALERIIRDDLVIVCRSRKMLDIVQSLDQIAESGSTVLIYGESGTGKELIARAIHSFSQRRSKPLVSVNCASLPETLLESELFGYERGAFTGAYSRKPGKFEIANGGTIFLDEIGDISLAAQAKILRVLQDGDFHRVGGTKEVNVDVRVIAATNKDLRYAIEQKTFRDDLYYRLKVVEIHLPPLRERPDDVPILAEYFLKTLKMKIPSTVERLSDDAIEILVHYPWPGNIRELRNVVERALVFARGDEILPEHLPQDIVAPLAIQQPLDATSPASLNEIERQHIQRVLKFTQGNKQHAAKILGISRATLYEKIKTYQL